MAYSTSEGTVCYINRLVIAFTFSGLNRPRRLQEIYYCELISFTESIKTIAAGVNTFTIKTTVFVVYS